MNNNERLPAVKAMEVDAEIECRIDDNAYGGDGIARVDGMVVFVKGAFKGETVKARIRQVKKRFAKAEFVELIEPSAEIPRLPRYTQVPGMVYAPIPPECELALKSAQLVNFLSKLDENCTIDEPVVCGNGLGYRNKVTYHVEGGRVGYREEGSHNVADIEYDPLACDPINAALADARRVAISSSSPPRSKSRSHDSRSDDVLTIRHTDLDGVHYWRGPAPRDLVLHEETAGLVFEVPTDGFYQVNPSVGEKLVEAVRKAYLEKPGDLLDLYCGVGVFGIACLKAAVGQIERTSGSRFPRLVGVESGRGAIACAKRNAAAAGIAANFFCERVGASLGRMRVSPGHTIVVDPPRGGLEPNVAPWLAKCGAARILYVSCDPATLTRDLEGMRAGYRISRVRLFQMFPRTARFETLVQLERKGV